MVSVGPCPRALCTAAAFRVHDELSYAVGHHLWVCADGHQTAEGLAR